MGQPTARHARPRTGRQVWVEPPISAAVATAATVRLSPAAATAATVRLRTPARGRGGRRVAVVLVASSLLYGLAVAMLLDRAGPPGAGHPGQVTAQTEAAQTETARPPGGPLPLPAETAVPPVGLSIPAIDVDESQVLPLGLAADGSMQVPEDYARVGWFTGASVPGTAGPAIIAGHVDSHAGPAVFFRLRELAVGDAVTVRLADGSRVTYVVDGVEQYPKNDFPTRTVFGPVPGEALRLITCGGSFDHVARSYRDNIVVYATRRAAQN